MGGESKLTTMAIKVDLDCHKCRKKIKKVLCKIPQIENQIYDEKANLVIITVWCCSPEKIKDKICCKGGESVKGIEIVKPPPPAKPKEPEKPKEKPKEPEKPKEKPKEPEKPKEQPKEKPKEAQKEKPKEKPQEAAKKPAAEPEKPKDKPAPKQVVIVEPEKPKQPAAKPPPAQPAPPPVQQAQPVPIGFPPVANRCCCQECYGGYGGGPCYSMPGPPYYEGYGRPVYDSWGGGGGYYPGPGAYSRGQCFSDDNASGCVVM
ncbi:Zinc metalloprotease ZmpB [Linum grandiflorum]